MKKILFLSLCMLGLTSYAQISVLRGDGSPINEGDIISYSTTAYPQANLDFHIHNGGASATLVRMRAVSITNSTGSALELCIGPVCLSSIHSGSAYPSSAFSIPANSTDIYANHIWNADAGDGVNYPMDFTFKVYQLDGSGNEIGNSVTFTYRYTGALSTNTFGSLTQTGLSLKGTLVQNQIEYNATTNGTISVLDTNGRIVKSTSVTIGDGIISTENLSNGFYILEFTNQDKKTASIKILKQ